MKSILRNLVHSIRMSTLKNRVCPHCGASVTFAQAKTYWATAVGMLSQAVPVRVESACCHTSMNMKQVKQLRWGNRAQATAWGRKLSAARETYGAGTGRPVKKKPCPFCKELFGARELRTHKPRCPKKPV